MTRLRKQNILVDQDMIRPLSQLRTDDGATDRFPRNVSKELSFCSE